MAYHDIRDKDGRLRVSVDDGFVAYLMSNIKGKWVAKNFVNEGKRMVYSFTESSMITRTLHGISIGVRLTIVAGDYIDINEG